MQSALTHPIKVTMAPTAVTKWGKNGRIRNILKILGFCRPLKKEKSAETFIPAEHFVNLCSLRICYSDTIT
jgi:hypothetical protein